MLEYGLISLLLATTAVILVFIKFDTEKERLRGQVQAACLDSEERFWSRLEAFESLNAITRKELSELTQKHHALWAEFAAFQKTHHTYSYIPKGDAAFHFEEFKKQVTETPVYDEEFVGHISELERKLSEQRQNDLATDGETTNVFKDLEI